MIEKIKQKKNYILSFFIPLFLLLLLFFALGLFFPSGKTIFTCDLQAQYKALYQYFRENLFSTYSFSKGIGGSMIGTYAYYLCSPFLFVLFLFPVSKLSVATFVMLLLKLCTSGLTMYIYLSSYFKDKKYLLIFSTSYVFMSYISAYFFHIMWMDAVYMLPLVMLGIDRIVEKKKPTLYIISLMVTILTNYYMGYIICLFAVLYFFYQLYLCKKNKRNILFMFFISSLLGGFLTSFLTIPTALELTTSVRTSVSDFSSISLSSPLEILSSLFLGSHNYAQILSRERYHVYVGIFVFILYLLYFFNPKIEKKEKRASLFLLVIFIFSMLINYVDMVWSAFSITSCFAGRYTFVFCFFLIFLAVKSFAKIKYIEIKHLFFIAPVYPILAILVLWKQFSFVKIPLVFVSVLLYFFYLVLLYCYIQYKDKKKLTLLLLLFLVFAELVLNSFFMLEDFKFQYKEAEHGLYKTFDKELSSLQEKDSSFYRLEKNFYRSLNDGFYFDYHGVRVFLSTISENQYAFFIRLGYSVYGNTIEYNRNMPVADSLLGIRYLFKQDGMNPYYEKIDSFPISLYDDLFYNLVKKEVSVYKNKYALRLGTVIPKKGKTCSKVMNIEDRLAYQNAIVSCLYGEDVSIYEKINMKKIEDNKYILKKDKKYNVYFYPNIVSTFLEGDDLVELFIEGKTVGEFTSNAFIIQEFIDDSVDREFTIELKSKNSGKYIPYAYYFRQDIYEDVFGKLKQNSMEIVEEKENYIKGNVFIHDKEGYLFTTIPYDTGFQVFVDGKRVDYEEILGAFVGVPMKKGKHVIEFKYTPNGLKFGIVISFVALVVTIFYIKYLEKKS